MQKSMDLAMIFAKLKGFFCKMTVSQPIPTRRRPGIVGDVTSFIDLLMSQKY
jgi:hypothetical protein